MTLESAASKAVYTGNGATTEFPFSFKVWDEDQILVSVTDTQGYVQETGEYSVTLSVGGGTVFYLHDGAPLPSGWKLAITRDMPFTQEDDYITGTRFDPEVIETALDKATAERQQLREQLQRAVILPPTSDETPEDMAQELLRARDDVQDIRDDVQDMLAEVGTEIGNHTIITAEGSTAGRTLADRFADVVNVKDFGAKGDGVTDDASAFFSAKEKGQILVPNGEYLVTVKSDEDLKNAISAIDGAVLVGSLTIKVVGHVKSSNPLVVDCKGGENFHIVGDYSDIVIVSVGAISGTPGDYSVPIVLASAAGISVGDVLVIRGDNCTVGTDAHEVLRGAWRITAVSGNTITVKNTCWKDQFPSFMLTSGHGFVLHSVITFEGCDGIIVKGATLGELDKVAIVGNASDYWMPDDIEGTERGTNGIYVGGATIVLNGKTDNANALGITNACASLGRYAAVLDFDQQGIVCTKGASIYARFVASCSNRRRGWYADLNGSIFCKNSVGAGNYLDGYISDEGGSISGNLSTAAGNGGNGFNCITNGTLQGARCVAVANKVDGFHILGSGAIYCSESVAKKNVNGFTTEFGGSIIGGNSVADGNERDGFYATSLGNIRALGCTATNNGRYGLYASLCGVISSSTDVTMSGNVSGDISTASLGYVYTASKSSAIQVPTPVVFKDKVIFDGNVVDISKPGVEKVSFKLSSVGDFSLSNSNGLLTIWKMGREAMIPGTDGETSLGRASNRWDVVFATSSSIDTSDARDKQGVQPYPDDVLDAWGNVQFRQFVFNEAVAKKGAAARLHSGIIAQQVVKTFANRGLDATRYGLLCFDRWPDEYEDVEVVDAPAVLDADGNEVIPAKTHTEKRLVTEAGERYGIRYSEALCMEAAYQRRRADRLEARIAALEAKLK